MGKRRKKNSNDEMTNSKKEYDRLRQVLIGVLDTKSAKNFINNLFYNNIAELAGYTYYYFGEIKEKDSNAFIDTAKKKKTDALKFIKEMIDLMNRSIEIIRYYDFLEKVYKDVSKYWDNNKDATTEKLLNECKKYLNVTKEINEEHKIEKEHWYFEFSKLLKEKVLQVDRFLYKNVTKDLIKDLDKAKDNLVAKLGDNIDEKNQKFVDSANELINNTTQFEKHEDFIEYSKKAEILKKVIVAVEKRLEENNSNIKSSKKNNEQKTAEGESIFDNSNMFDAKGQSLDDKNFKGKSVVEENYDLNGPSTSSNNISVAKGDDLSNSSFNNQIEPEVELNCVANNNYRLNEGSYNVSIAPRMKTFFVGFPNGEFKAFLLKPFYGYTPAVNFEGIEAVVRDDVLASSGGKWKARPNTMAAIDPYGRLSILLNSSNAISVQGSDLQFDNIYNATDNNHENITMIPRKELRPQPIQQNTLAQNG